MIEAVVYHEACTPLISCIHTTRQPQRLKKSTFCDQKMKTAEDAAEDGGRHGGRRTEARARVKRKVVAPSSVRSQ